MSNLTFREKASIEAMKLLMANFSVQEGYLDVLADKTSIESFAEGIADDAVAIADALVSALQTVSPTAH